MAVKKQGYESIEYQPVYASDNTTLYTIDWRNNAWCIAILEFGEVRWYFLPIGDDERTFLLKHFLLEERRDAISLENLRNMSPEYLASLQPSSQ